MARLRLVELSCTNRARGVPRKRAVILDGSGAASAAAGQTRARTTTSRSDVTSFASPEFSARQLRRYTASVPKRVLIVEDDPEVMHVLQEFFVGLEHGYNYE